MWPFKPKAPTPRREVYGLAYACDDKHVRLSENNGICMQCGKSTKPAVAVGDFCTVVGWLPYGDGFVRWHLE